MTFNVYRSIWAHFGGEGFVVDQHKVVTVPDIHLIVPSKPLIQSQILFEFIKIQFITLKMSANVLMIPSFTLNYSLFRQIDTVG